MLSSAVFGGIEARAALEKSMFDDEQADIGIDWCAGSCQKWDQDEAGRKRMKMLQTKFCVWRLDHPKEYQELEARVSGRKESDVRTTKDDG